MGGQEARSPPDNAGRRARAGGPGHTLVQRRPVASLRHHSDRGSQCTSADYQAKLAAHGSDGSMSRKGRLLGQRRGGELLCHAGDGTDRRGRLGDAGLGPARDSPSFIERWCNRERGHSNLGCRSPVELELLILQRGRAACSRARAGNPAAAFARCRTIAGEAASCGPPIAAGALDTVSTKPGQSQSEPCIQEVGLEIHHVRFMVALSSSRGPT